MFSKFFAWLRGKAMHNEHREIVHRLEHLQAWVEYIAHQNDAIFKELSTSPMPTELSNKLAELIAHKNALVAALAANAPKPPA